MKGLKSGATIKLEIGNIEKLSSAGKIELVLQLLGDQPIYDEDGEEVGRTPRLITEEQARKILGMEE